MRKLIYPVLFSLLCAIAIIPAPVYAQSKKSPVTPPSAKPPQAKSTTARPTGTSKVEPTPVSPATSHIWALLVGISKYQSPQIAALRFPATDAQGLRDALVDKELGGLPATNVKLITDDQATAPTILGAIDSFLKPNVKPGDQVVVFLAGHGVAKGVGLNAKSYLLPTDVKGLTSAALEESAVSLRQLSDKLGQLPASQFVVFVDACREDPTPGRGVKGNLLSDVMSRGIQITPTDSSRPLSSASFFACSVGQRAFEDPSFNHGVFTYWILEGIRSAAAARKPDGAVDMGVLASYVKSNVASWAKQASEKGDFEIDQTPDFVASEITDPIILMRVKRPLPATAVTTDTPNVTVLSDPPGAQVSIDGEKMGASPLTHAFPGSGTHTLRVEAIGYAPLERTVNALDGYDLLLTVSPAVGTRGVGAPDSQAMELYQRAQDAANHQQWEVAEAGYGAVLTADPKFVPAYEQLATMERLQGKLRPAIDTLTQMVAKSTPTAHGYSLLADGYGELARREAPVRTSEAEKPKKKNGGLGGLFGKGDKDSRKEDDFGNGPATYVVPKDWKEAAILSRRAAENAIKLDANSAEANRAAGIAAIVTDQGGKNKERALAAFGKAIFLDPKDASNHYALGYGIRYFAANLKEESERNTELDRAVNELKAALDLRPNYYEAHRELAYCYHLQEKNKDAQNEYEQANANRGAAGSADEVAALNLSLSSLYRELAQGVLGEKQAGYLAAAEGYLGDAKDITPNLTEAIRILAAAQLSTRIARFMPPELQKILDLPDDLRNKLKLPGGGGLPGLPGAKFP